MHVDISRTLTVEVTEDTFQRIQETARRTGHSPERVVGEILDLSLSSAATRTEADWRRRVERHRRDSPAELREQLRVSLSAPDQARMQALLDTNRKRSLTDEEAAELDRLQNRMLEVATERAAALYLLQQRSKVAE